MCRQLQCAFASRFPRHRGLLVVERLTGETLPPTWRAFAPDDTYVFREFRPPARDPVPELLLHRLRRPMDHEIDYRERQLPARAKTKVYAVPGEMVQLRAQPAIAVDLPLHTPLVT